MTRGKAVRLAAAIAGASMVAACSGTGGFDLSADTTVSAFDGGDCIVVTAALSPEKIELFQELASDFNDSGAEVNGTCVVVDPYRKSSGAAATLLMDGWPTDGSEGELPVVWSPSASTWGAIVNEDQGRSLATGGTPFMLTPLVIAMPQPMADALGYPETPIGFADIVELANNPEGWAAYGHPEWGPFRLGKTNPNFSTSGLSFTVAEYYAATGKRSGLTVEDLDRSDVQQLVSDVESAVVHYGDTTLTFLNNWYRADARNTALTYASAVAVEEKSLLDYNSGNPDGITDPGETPIAPNVPLVAIYPAEGTLFSDNPYYVLDADWVSEEQKAGAALFEDFIQQPQNQAKVLSYGFRPGNPAVEIGAPIIPDNGVDPNQPQAELAVPDGRVLSAVIEKWGEQRKSARVLLVLDVSGSMGDPVDDRTTKLDLAKQAAISSLGEFKDDDEVGLWVFTTDIDQNDVIDDDPGYVELVPVSRVGNVRERLRNEIDRYPPLNGTPLYGVTQSAFDAMTASYDTTKINAIVLLTDGVNDDGVASDDSTQLNALINSMRSGTEGSRSQPVRVFSISYGADADTATLRRISEASNAALYEAANPKTIEQVFLNVVSNF
ncbi:MAG: substrate-binding domain-containing protein [Ilumatobacteraceae bacterium]